MKSKINREITGNKLKNFILFSLFLSLVLLAVLYLWTFNHTNLIYRGVEELKRKEATLITENRIIAMDIERLSRADRITEIASTQLDMFIPVPETVAIIINSDIIYTK